MKEKITMSLKDLMEEHRRLIRALRSDDKTARLREVKKQKMEIKNYGKNIK